jgi:cell division septum initiation protein DivIVA
VTDNRVKDRVRVPAGVSPDGVTTEHPVIAAAGRPNQALHVLTLAQRTAEEHLAVAQHQADKIRADALAKAEEIGRDAQMHAHTVRREAEKVLHDARGAAQRTERDAQARAEEARRSADKIVADARAAADAVARTARAGAQELTAQAQQRYDDVVGSLGLRREALQEQIEALERFDREYRGRLTGFMQSQLRALWADRPEAGELSGAGDGAHDTAAPAHIPAQRPGPDAAAQPAPGADAVS